MLRDKRVNDNWALIEAQKIALENNVPLKVCFNINNNYPEANLRQYKFLFEGLREVQKTLDDIKNDIIKSKKNWVSEYQNFFDKLKND